MEKVYPELRPLENGDDPLGWLEPRLRNAASRAKLYDPMGPPKPAPLVTVTAARKARMRLNLHCAPCNRYVVVEADTLKPTRRTVSLGEMWLRGRFRCGGCKRPATWVKVCSVDQLTVEHEVWGVGEPLVAERLRRHWRHDPYDRRDWAQWFGRGR